MAAKKWLHGKRHKIVLNKLTRDERLHPSRRLLAELLSLTMDTEGDDRDRMMTILVAQYGLPTRVKWGDSIEDKRTMQDSADKDSIPVLKNYFERSLTEIEAEEPDEVSEPIVY